MHGKNAISRGPYLGPSFGQEIRIRNNQYNYGFQGSSRVLRNYSREGVNATFLSRPFAGSSTFEIEEMEVFELN